MKGSVREGRSVKAPLLDVECSACAERFEMRADFDRKEQKCPHCGVLLTVDRVEYLVSELFRDDGATTPEGSEG